MSRLKAKPEEAHAPAYGIFLNRCIWPSTCGRFFAIFPSQKRSQRARAPDVHLLPPFPIQDIILRPIVIYPERAFGVSLIVTGSVLVALILTTQTALSHFKRHRSQTLRKVLPQKSTVDFL